MMRTSKKLELRARELAGELGLTARWTEKPNAFLVREGFELVNKKTETTVAGRDTPLSTEQVIAYCEKLQTDRRAKAAVRKVKARPRKAPSLF